MFKFAVGAHDDGDNLYQNVGDEGENPYVNYDVKDGPEQPKVRSSKAHVKLIKMSSLNQCLVR